MSTLKITHREEYNEWISVTRVLHALVFSIKQRYKGFYCQVIPAIKDAGFVYYSDVYSVSPCGKHSISFGGFSEEFVLRELRLPFDVIFLEKKTKEGGSATLMSNGAVSVRTADFPAPGSVLKLTPEQQLEIEFCNEQDAGIWKDAIHGLRSGEAEKGPRKRKAEDVVSIVRFNASQLAIRKKNPKFPRDVMQLIAIHILSEKIKNK